MRQLAIMCCLCEKIRDDRACEPEHAVWQDFRLYLETYGLRPESVRVSHTYCPDCLASYKHFLAARKAARDREELEKQA